VIKSLTDYISTDKDAMDFIAGKPDPWGMVVNPSYKNIKLPVSEWPLLDTFKPTSDLECLKENPAVYLAQVAAPVSDLRTIAEAVLDGWPNVQTRCDKPTPVDPFKLGRVDRQGVGSRFMMGITSLGDAARFDLRTAALETTPGHFAGPSNASMAAAVGHVAPGGSMQPFTLSQATLRKDPSAYPGTMVVYTAARTKGLDKSDAGKVAQFIRVSTTEGQRPGGGNGELPDGFLPIRASGPTAPLFRAAQVVAAAIAGQHGKNGPGGGPGAHQGTTGTGGQTSGGVPLPGTGAGVTAGAAAAAGAPGGAAPGTSAGAAGAPATTTTAASTLSTASQSSRLGALAIPALLFLALLGGLGTALLRVWQSRQKAGA
jgi:hypothetical protein